MRALNLFFFVSLALSSTTAYAKAPSWGSDSDKVRKGMLGELWKEPIRYELRTQFATLHKSHVRLEVDWFDHSVKKEIKQIFFEDTRPARIDDYKVKYTRKKRQVTVSYHCPIDRDDETTVCTEVWVWQKSSRRFTRTEKTSTNPVAGSRDEILKLIRDGKHKLASTSIKTMRKRHGAKSVPLDAFFEAYFLEITDRALKLHKRGKTRKAILALKDFLDNPPLTPGLDCPDAEQFTVCLQGKRVCGCSDPFGTIPWSKKHVRRVERLVSMFAKAREHDLVVRFGKPVADKYTERTAATLAVADSYWATRAFDKAREYYTLVRKVRMAQGKPMPRRVLQRFDAEDP